MKKLLCAALILSVLFCVCACTKTAEPAVPDISDEELYALTLTEEEWPIVDGATAFLPYYTAAASRILGVTEEEASRYVLCSTTDYAYPNLIYGKADVIFCLLPSEDQVRLADHEGVTLALYPVLNEAFVFFVNKDNPVDELSRQQLHDIYAGKITNWKQVGGNDEPIVAYQRSEGSGSQTGLYTHVINRDELMDPPTELRIGTMDAIVEAVASYDNARGALGYSYLYFVKNQHFDEDIKLLRIEGVDPDKSTIQSGAYPMISQACAVIRGGEEDTPAGKIAQWCAWPLGQKLALEKGYVPNMAVAAPEPQQTAEEETPSSHEWAEGRPMTAGGARTVRRNNLTVEYLTPEETEQTYITGIRIDGMKDTELQERINERIEAAVASFSDPEYLPDAQGIRLLEREGLSPADFNYKYISANAMANFENVLSVIITCSSYYELPSRPDMPYAVGDTLFFSNCETINVDLGSGLDIPITAFITDNAGGLDYLDSLAKQYVSEHPETLYNDEDTFGETYGFAEESVRITGFPGLKEDQKYYLNGQDGRLYLVLDSNTPWAVTGNAYSCMPLDPGKRSAFSRFAREDASLFTDETERLRLLETFLTPSAGESSDYGPIADTGGSWWISRGNYEELTPTQNEAMSIYDEDIVELSNIVAQSYDSFRKVYGQDGLSCYASLSSYAMRFGDYTTCVRSRSANVMVLRSYNAVMQVNDETAVCFKGDSDQPMALSEVFTEAGWKDILADAALARMRREGVPGIDPAALESFCRQLYSCVDGFRVEQSGLSLHFSEDAPVAADVFGQEAAYDIVPILTYPQYDDIGAEHLTLFDR